jgi:tRNA pseudouridine(55) synthase
MLSYHNNNFLPESKDDLLVQVGIFTIYKYSGETLSSLLERFRLEQNLDSKLPVTYAGRLDPMAEGLVLLLTGEKCKEKDSFLGLDKTYVFEILFGVSTDTFDMLGIIDETKEITVTEQEVLKSLEKIKNKISFAYPPFSSKPFEGKPLFIHAKEGTLPKELPEIKGEIKEISLKNLRTESFKDVIERSIEIIKNVQGDFRQEEILEGWRKFLDENENKECFIAKCEATVSSGIYIRSIAVEVGKILDAPSLAYSIKRTSVGKYK